MAEQNPYLKNPDLDFAEVDELAKKEASEQAEDLREAIEYHDYQYYVKNNPLISDEAYDKLFHRLQQLEQEFPGIQTDNSPTRRIGVEPVDEFADVEHQAEMLSLDSGLEEEKIKDFVRTVLKEHQESADAAEEGVKLSLEPKLDGLSVEIVYDNGEFTYGATRGDGFEGEDISRNLRTVNPIPLKLQGATASYLSVRGELLMLKDGFQELNRKRIEENKEPYANPRNAAAGTIRQLDSGKVADKPLDIYFYDLLAVEGASFQSQEEILKTLPEWGLKTSPENRTIRGGSAADVFQKIADYRNELGVKRDNLNYEIDGIVIKADDLQLREEMGSRDRSPRWAKAWKFPAKKDITRLKDIVIQVGRTGILTPVALLEPVDIDGVTVSRATLHNESEVRKKGLHPGDRVKIARAGDVIPEVVERVREDEEEGAAREEEGFSLPSSCPVCGTEVVKEGKYYICPNGLSCQAQLVGSVAHFADREAADIEHLGEEVARQLVENDLITDLADIYYLQEGDLKDLPGFADKSAENLIKAVRDSREIRLDRFFYGLGIRHVGSHLSRLLAEEYDSLQELMAADLEELKSIDEIGQEIAGSIVNFFADDKNRAAIRQMKEAGVKLKPLKIDRDSPAAGKTFVFTGRLENYTREEVKDRVERLGAEAASSVSGNTHYLVAGADPGSKLDQAREEDVEILDEEGFERLIDS